MASTKYQHTTDEMLAFPPLPGILPLRDQVHANRLRFLARLMQACPQITWALMSSTAAPHSWAQLCLESCQWLLMHYDSKLPLTDQSTFLEWVNYVRLDPNWKGRIRKTCKLALAFHKSRAANMRYGRDTLMPAWQPWAPPCQPRTNHRRSRKSGNVIFAAKSLPPLVLLQCMLPEAMATKRK